mmetsp:Transcript_52146/g.58263  ORF Transcript_52146/g.58263 Transcript_52146/m.58263 type:complete len:85 (+) Transcript_52146:377-631(+)
MKSAVQRDRVVISVVAFKPPSRRVLAEHYSIVITTTTTTTKATYSTLPYQFLHTKQTQSVVRFKATEASNNDKKHYYHPIINSL